MKVVVLLYNTCCIYEIVILNYFLKFTGKQVEFVSINGNPVNTIEGYSINVTGKLRDINIKDVELLVIPGGDVNEINNKYVWNYIWEIKENNGLIAAICAGVDVLDSAGILKEIESTHSTDIVDGLNTAF